MKFSGVYHQEYLEKPMATHLNSEGKSARFTSNVSYVEIQGRETQVTEKWVAKVCEELDVKHISEVIAEIAAYRISLQIAPGLVPETHLYVKDSIGSIQRYIDPIHIKNPNEYEDLLTSNTLEIRTLKLFWFILGQWDTSNDNVFFLHNGYPIAIDNANIANIQCVKSYGSPHFVRTFWVEHEDSGSLDEPIMLKGSGYTILSQLMERFDVPQYLQKSLESEAEMTFSYFVKDGRVWCDFNPSELPPIYFLDKATVDSKSIKQLIESFAPLKNGLPSSIFENLLKELVEEKHEVSEFASKLSEHCEEITDGILGRYSMVEQYFSDDITVVGEF